MQAVGHKLAFMDVARFRTSPLGHLVPLSGVDGRFKRPFEHVAYVADRLADEPPLSAQTWRVVTAAHRALARLDQASRQVPAPDLLRRPALRREAQSTSALEGTFAPLEDVLAADADERATSKELLEVLNYVRAANLAFDAVTDQGRVTVGLLEEVHRVLVAGTPSETRDAGRIRSTPVAIGSPTGSVHDARFVPMPPGTELDVAVRDWLSWLNDAPSPRDPLVAAAMAHYQFETLHPFNDGNGRIGRLMIVLQFMRDGLLGQPLLTVSPWFEARRPEYQEHLAAVSATGDWDPWVQFFAAGIESSSDDTARRVDRLLAVQARYVQLVQDNGGRGVVRDLVDALIGDPIVTISMLARMTGKTVPAVSAAVTKLTEWGILGGPIGTYNRQFIATDVWRAVTAPVGRVPDADEPLDFEAGATS